METQLEFAKSRLFDKDALRVSNIKFFPGTSREVTAEQIAEQTNKAISQIAAGDFDPADDIE